MRIAIDLRSLHTGAISGVENYIVNLLEVLLRLDTQNSYTLFYNGFRPIDLSHYQYINTRLAATRIPNKLLNLSLKFLNKPTFDRLAGEFDCLFLPNFNFVALKPHHKLAITVHDLSPLVRPEFYNLKRRLWHTFLNIPRLVKRADIIFAVSEYTKEVLLQRCEISADKIRVVYPGINHQACKPSLPVAKLRDARNRYSLPGNFILYLGTLEPRKNVVGLIEAFERLDMPIHLVLAGKKGWKYKEIFSKIRSSPKKKYIHYLGYIPEVDKPAVMKLAQLFAFPSFYEGFGFPAVEALALGVPVVTSAVTSLPEAVSDSALLVNPYSNYELLAALREGLTNTSLRQGLIKKGTAQASRFTWEQTATEIIKGFQSLS
jgi:glycosyltransferase involved in cell wall biosynthesis